MSVEDIVGLLRFEILFHGRIVVPDSHLFDGSLLLDRFDPKSIAAALAHSDDNPTIEFRMRAKTFEDSLMGWLWNERTQRLNPLEFRYLRDEIKEMAVAESISRFQQKVTRADILGRLKYFLRDAGVSHETIDLLRDRWAAWKSVQESGLMRRWPTAPYLLSRVVSDSVLPLDAIATPEGQRCYQEIFNVATLGRDTRSATADQILRNSFERVTSRAHLLDVGTIRDWYHDCRQVALAKQHNCDLTSRPVGFANLWDSMEDDAPVEIPIERSADADSIRRIMYVLAMMSSADFSQLMGHTATSRRDWLSRRGMDSGRAALDRHVSCVLENISGQSRAADEKPWYQQERIVIPSSATVVGYLSGSGLDVVGNPEDGTVGALAAGVIGVGLTKGSTKLREALAKRGEHMAVVRWIGGV